MWSSSPRNRISCVVGDQAGNQPPSVEIFHLPPGPGKGRTNTSFRPDSLDAYARNFPSGENDGPTWMIFGSAKNDSALPALGRSGSLRIHGKRINARPTRAQLNKNQPSIFSQSGRKRVRTGI